MLDINKDEADLSRRAPRYVMQGLSFREYLAISRGLEVPVCSWEQVLDNEANIAAAQALVASGHELRFHTFEVQGASKPVPYEIDFLVVRGGRLCPVEVKSSGYRRHASLDQLFRKYGVDGAESYVLTPKDLSREGNLTYIPLYMAMCL